MHSHTSIHFWFFLTMCLGHPWMHAQGRFPEQPSEAEGPELTWRTTIEPIPSAPNYTSAAAWSVLPADVSEDGFALLPPKTHRRTSLASCPDSLKADVFFIHPTMLLEGDAWNADVQDDAMNAEVDRWPIRHQASAFAGAGRVFAPRYRQAHIRIFSLGDSLSWAACDVAYNDVKRAFEHFLTHWNDGRPIVLAGHSQGSFHGRRLLQEYVDGTALADRLVAAYFPGMDMYEEEFKELPLCQNATDVGCLCTWMTYGQGFLPRWLKKKMLAPTFTPVLCTHPVTWNTSSEPNDLDAHLGVVRPSYRLSKPAAMRGFIVPEGVIWVDAPQVLGGRWLQRDNWHSGDLNLFWVNVHNNAVLRTREWHMKQGLRSTNVE